jgi:hypothetical protein
MHDIIVVEQQQQHLWMMNLARTIIPTTENLVEEENLFSFCDCYQNLKHSTT